MTDITELTSVQKNANIHRLSRLIAYAPNDELRQSAVEVEQYTEQLIEALELYKSREDRVTSLVRDNSKSWDELYRQVEAKDKRNAELVEALEKAQHEARVDWEAAASLNVENLELKRRIAELEDAEQKLCAANVTLDARAELAERRLSEMESRTVTAEKLQESAYRTGLTAGWNLGLTNNNDGFNKCLAAHSTASIK
ncbi:hypothetical protein KC235_17800 [Klebsiella michiganensis]|nr:hypothetical protein [Klebsiella michiganensis]MBR7640699.1 hypothetical protein [Klebsiella michiganensis]